MSARVTRGFLPITFVAAAGCALPCFATCRHPGKLPVDIRDCGAALTADGNTNTAAINSALVAGNIILIPSGNWLVNGFVVPAGKTVLTGGLSTVLRNANYAIDEPIVTVSGSNVRVDSFTADGQVAKITPPVPEHSHAMAISGSSPISNVALGDIIGHNIAGDVLYISGTATAAPVSTVTFGIVTGSNVRRSIVSIVGGVDITGAAVVGGNCGYTTLDIEPNPGSQKPDRISIGLVRGGKIQLASGDPTIVIGIVAIDTVDLNSDFQSPPTPPYAPGGVSKFDTDIGILASYWQTLRINNLYSTKKGWSAFYSSSWSSRQAGSIEIGNYIGSGNGAVNQHYGEFSCEGCSRLKIDSGSTQLYSNQKPLFTGGVRTVYEIENFTFSGGGVVALRGFGVDLSVAGGRR